MPPLVSIALCTYNGKEFLAAQLDSLLLQDYGNIEIVAVDDCSADGTWDILREYAANDHRLKTHRNKHNLGHSLNFERAISLCTGDYIALSDQDDLWEPGKITRLMSCIDGHVMIYHDSDFVDANGKRMGNKTMSSQCRMYDGKSSLPVILANCIHGHAILFNSKLRDYLFPFSNNFSHDWAIAYAAFNIGSVKYLPEVLVHYRQHQNSVTDYLEQRKKQPARKSRGLKRLPVTKEWLQYCLAFKKKRDETLITEACSRFLDVMAGKKRIFCFIFMLKHFDLLFYTLGRKKRGFVSKANFVRKLCFE